MGSRDVVEVVTRDDLDFPQAEMSGTETCSESGEKDFHEPAC
jgi:hypothetical protein